MMISYDGDDTKLPKRTTGHNGQATETDAGYDDFSYR